MSHFEYEFLYQHMHEWQPSHRGKHFSSSTQF